MEILILSLLILVAAPLLYRVVHRYSHSIRFIDRSVFFIVFGLVVYEIVEHSLEVIGYWTVPVLALGWIIPFVLESNWKNMTEKIHLVPLALAILGLFIHGMMDGFVMVLPEFDHSHGVAALPYAVIIHRLPLSVFIWWLLYPSKGWPLPTFILFVYGFSTVVGYFVGTEVLEQLHSEWTFAVFQAIVAGSLLHLAGHDHASGQGCDHHKH